MTPQDPKRPLDYFAEELEANPAVQAAVQAALARNSEPLPEIQRGPAFMARHLPEPPQIVWGVLHKGCKMVVGGGSKSFKTWTLLYLALAVATGRPWLGFKTFPGRSLFVNLELPEWAVQARLRSLSAALEVDIPESFSVWNLRGKSRPYHELIPKIVDRIRSENIDAVTLDPMYKLLGQADENSASDITNLLNCTEQITELGPSLSWGSHFSKGNQSSKSAMDRISGSGVFARDPDSIITFTPHEDEGSFSVDIVLRNHPPVDPFVVSWNKDLCLMQRDDDKNPLLLKQPEVGRPETYRPEELLQFLAEQPLPTHLWQKKALDELGVSRTSFHRFLSKFKAEHSVTKTPDHLWKLTQ